MATLSRFLKQYRSISAFSYRNQKRGIFFTGYQNHGSLPSQIPALQSTTRSFLDFCKFGNRGQTVSQWSNDEMTRGYFAEMKEYKEHGGKYNGERAVPGVLLEVITCYK